MTDNPGHVDRMPIQPATVTLTIPCSAEYVSVARLAILGIASRMPFSYDEVEDVRLAVGEACTHAVERAKIANDASSIKTLIESGLEGDTHEITIVSKVSEATLTIEVSDTVPLVPPGSVVVADDFEDAEIDHQGLGALLIEILVDEVEIDSRSDGTTVRLHKHAPVHQ